MCSPSLVHPKPIQLLRDLTRYQRSTDRQALSAELELLRESATKQLLEIVAQVTAPATAESASDRAVLPTQR